MPCSCCLKAHLHVSLNMLGSEHCQTGLVHSMRVHRTTEMNTLILGHHFEITLKTNQVKLKPNKKRNLKWTKIFQRFIKTSITERKEKGISYGCCKVKTTRKLLHRGESTVWSHLPHQGLAHRMPFMHSQFAFTREKKKNQGWCSLLPLLLKFKAPFSHCVKDTLIALQQEAISPIFPLGQGELSSLWKCKYAIGWPGAVISCAWKPLANHSTTKG